MPHEMPAVRHRYGNVAKRIIYSISASPTKSVGSDSLIIEDDDDTFAKAVESSIPLIYIDF